MCLDLRQRGGVLFQIGTPNTDSATSLCDGVGHTKTNPTIATGDHRDLAGQIERLIGHGGLLIVFRKLKCQRGKLGDGIVICHVTFGWVTASPRVVSPRLEGTRIE